MAGGILSSSTDPVGIEMAGLVWNASVYSTSGLGLETNGLIFLLGDNWVPGLAVLDCDWIPALNPVVANWAGSTCSVNCG